MNLHRTAGLFVAVIFLCLVLYVPCSAHAASAGEAGFILTEQLLDNLRQAGLPNDIIDKLKSLKDQKFDTEEKFLEAVRQEIGNDQTARYKEQIVMQANRDISGEINRITEALEAQRRTIDALLEQNRALENRLAELEVMREDRMKQQELEERVKELEYGEIAREDATRSIIRDAVSTLGSKINESVSLGGTLEIIGGWTEDYAGRSEGQLKLNTAEFDFEIEVNEWTLGSIVLEYEDGTNAVFPTTSGFETGVDRINIDTAYIRIGDPQRFPPSMTVGRIILPFGISTGDPVADVLTIEDPLTIEVFELRNTAVGFGLGFPTPALTPITPPVTPPPVRSLVLNPLISSISRALGYKPSPTPPPTPIIPAPAPPLFNIGIYSYDGSSFEGGDTGGYRPEDHFGATVGFRTKGNCGRSYNQLEGSFLCPWSVDIDVDYNSSIFDSRFLEFEYRDFLGQIGFVEGMAASIKGTFGPVSMVGEWNGAIDEAKFIDELGTSVKIKPSAWQVTLGYQFDWNPWVEEIGAQGDYLAISYSESRDMAGVMRLLDGESIKVGFVPERRFILGAGEWVLSNLRVAVEYSYNKDYDTSKGGTGKSADGVFSTITVVW